jgi:hypothetical protein
MECHVKGAQQHADSLLVYPSSRGDDASASRSAHEDVLEQPAAEEVPLVSTAFDQLGGPEETGPADTGDQGEREVIAALKQERVKVTGLQKAAGQTPPVSSVIDGLCHVS